MRIKNKLEKLENKFWKKIVENPNVLKSLLASNERLNLISRLAVIELMASGKSHREISRELDVSRQTISSIKKSLETKEYKSYRQRGKTERKKKVFSPIPKKPLSKDFVKYLEGKRAVKTKYGTIYTKF